MIRATAQARILTRAFCHGGDDFDGRTRPHARPVFEVRQVRPSQGAPGVSWFAVNRGHLEYRGRIRREAFTTWCATKAGQRAIARVAAGIRFSFFGRGRSARRRLWRSLDEVLRSREFTRLMEAEPDRYLQVLADACYAEALPRLHVALRRLVLMPRALVTGRAKADVYNRLRLSAVLAPLDVDLRAFVLDRIVVEMDAALRGATPSARKPVRARDGWACVGVRLGTVWLDPLWAGPDGTGHLFMYEMPPQGPSRKDCKALDAAMGQLSGTVSTLSRESRDALIRSAALRRA